MNITVWIEIIGITVTLGIVSFYFWKQLRSTREELTKTQSQLRSVYVKFGKTFEHFIPFSQMFPGNKEKTVFLGMPVDYIVFDETMIKFVEVKTGNSQLNANQKRIKKLVEEHKVEFIELRYNHSNSDTEESIQEVDGNILQINDRGEQV